MTDPCTGVKLVTANSVLWGSKDFSDGFKFLTQSCRVKNPNYAYFLFDDIDCENFIKKNFNENVYNAYCRTFGSWIGYLNIQQILKMPDINDDSKRSQI